MYLFRKGKHSLAETRISQGPFKGPCKAQWRTMAGHGPCWGKLLCPHSPLIWFFLCLECKNMATSRFSPVGLFKDYETPAWLGLSTASWPGSLLWTKEESYKGIFLKKEYSNFVAQIFSISCCCVQMSVVKTIHYGCMSGQVC